MYFAVVQQKKTNVVKGLLAFCQNWKYTRKRNKVYDGEVSGTAYTLCR